MAQRIDWLRDELVLAADLVSRNGWVGVRASDSQVLQLSRLLREGTLHPGRALPDNFRSPSSIQRKSFDLSTSDPSYRGRATRGAARDASVLAAFREDPAGMQAEASAIRGALAAKVDLPPEWATDVEEPTADEGRIVEYLGRRRERDPKLRADKIDAVVANGDSLICEVCQFDFGNVYGPRGDRYIEVHHRTPLHISGPVKSSISDLALLCANCHRMCHRGSWITPDELVAILQTARSA